MRIRWALASFVVALSSPAFAADPAQQQEKLAGEAPKGHLDVLAGYRYMLGRVSRQHVQVCLGDQEEEWVDPHYEAGFVRLVTRRNLQLKALEGKAALLWGKVDPEKRFPHPGHKGFCPGRQARMDWVFSKNGVRLLRNVPQLRPESFSVVQAQAFEGLQVMKKGEEILVNVTNRLPVPLSDVEIVMHYEGCYGKPGSVAKSKEFGLLPKGETVGARFPIQYTVVPKPSTRWPARPRQHHVAYSLQLRSKDARVLVDLDMPLHVLLGERLRCDERDEGKKKLP